ncbi:MAG: glycosyltransferase family 4 protein [Acidobacteria bacterium]|nr:glycosyltransferase family 4 protein [Acidobacteriota bacterium]
MKVLVLNNVPAPYFLPVFEKLGSVPNWELTVCYSANWNSSVGWQGDVSRDKTAYKVIVLDQVKEGWRKYVGSSLSAVIALLCFILKEKPNYFICYGYTLMPQVFLLCWATLTGVDFALIGDANYFFDKPKGLRRPIKNFWLRFVTKKASALIEIGMANRQFWEKYGARPSQLFQSRLVVDNQLFFDASVAKTDRAKEFRQRFGFTDKIVFLFVGRLIKRKNVDLIIRATHQLDSDRFGLIIAGDGEEVENLKRLAGNRRNIVFTGNVSQDELPVFYKMADVLVLPADQEPWGLVINEAMACGLAIIAFQYCGAAVDLVEEGTGIKLQEFSVAEVAKAMELLINNPLLLRAMQINSRAKIQAWSIENAAEGIVQAVTSTWKRK